MKAETGARTTVVAPGIVIDLQDLTLFLGNAKQATYATGGGKVPDSRLWIPGNKEYEYKGQGFYYRDSFTGFLMAPGRELVKLENENGLAIWSMSYDGGLIAPYNIPTEENITLAKHCFAFLKRALKDAQKDLPLRGPRVYTERFADPGFLYNCTIKGTIERFSGNEYMYKFSERRSAKQVFAQHFSGGIIIHK